MFCLSVSVCLRLSSLSRTYCKRLGFCLKSVCLSLITMQSSVNESVTLSLSRSFLTFCLSFPPPSQGQMVRLGSCLKSVSLSIKVQSINHSGNLSLSLSPPCLFLPLSRCLSPSHRQNRSFSLKCRFVISNGGQACRLSLNTRCVTKK